MARSTCPKCENTTFEMVENSPRNSQFKVMFIQCASCGAVIGVADYYNIGNQNVKTQEAIKKIARQLNIHVDL